MSQEVKEQKETKARRKPKNTKKPKPVLVYCGPSIPNAGLMQFAVFRGEPPARVKKHMENPAVKALFVEPKELSQVRNNLQKSGTREHRMFKKAQEYTAKLRERR